jgi:Fe-S oxidoreductase
LGRHSGVFEEPRQVLESIPGVRLVELFDSRQRSLCCGGGGGRVWMETRKEERFADIRLAQAVSAGAHVLATACPYCLVNFEASLPAEYDRKPLLVKDITEMVAEAL